MDEDNNECNSKVIAENKEKSKLILNNIMPFNM